MSMPKQRPGKSKQNYGTPDELLQAIVKRLKIDWFSVDLAAERENAVVQFYYDADQNSLTYPWHKHAGWLWLNPPFNNIKEWAAKCEEEAKKGAHIVMLVPASVGANWWRDHVTAKAYVSYLNGRITFKGCEDPYPKDCALVFYTPWGFHGAEVWTWQQEISTT